MATYLCNITKGRIAEFYNRVKSNDPTNSALILVPVSASGVQATIVDADTLALVLASATEQTTSWSRKTLTDVELAAFPAPDDSNDRYDVSVPAVTWTAPSAGNNTTGLVMGYDSDTTSGTDSNILPIGHYDFAVTADGNDVVLNAGVFFRAS